MSHHLEINDSMNEIKYTCLIVEDNQSFADLMAAYLAKHAVFAETAGNGHIGLKMYLDNPTRYDIIFLDIQMPIMDGHEMAKRLRESYASTALTIPIVAMSGSNIETSIEATGFTSFIRKPFDLHELLDISEQLITR